MVMMMMMRVRKVLDAQGIERKKNGKVTYFFYFLCFLEKQEQ